MKRPGIKLYIIGCLAIALTGCKNDEVVPDEAENALLTKISRNGITQLELLYDIDKKLYRVDYYFGGTFSSYNLYEYSEEGIKELRRYNADDHSLDYRTVLTLDNFGRIIKGENYSSPDFFNEIASTREFDYNTSGQLISNEFRTPGNPVFSVEEYTYDEQNNLIMFQYTLNPNQPDEYLSHQIDYTPGSQPLPDFWEDYVFILGLSGLDDGIRDMFNAGSVFKAWNSDQEQTSELNIEASGHEFDDNGNLTRQVLTQKNILKPENVDIVSEMTYEYAQ